MNNNIIVPDDIQIEAEYCIESGSNLLILGATGSGKTVFAKSLAKLYPNKIFHEPFNMGAMSDPKISLIGNTLFGDNQTLFNESYFVKAITTPNSVIILDELTRAPKDAWNIMMSVLDPNQRFLRIDEKQNTPLIRVADGVSFIATGNVGYEYTATNKLDLAYTDRFSIVYMKYLNYENELKLLKSMFPTAPLDIIKGIVGISEYTRTNSNEFTRPISTKMNVEILKRINKQLRSNKPYLIQTAFKNIVLNKFNLKDSDKLMILFDKFIK